MLTQEMHLEIDLELQKLNSQINKEITAEQKDWFLNNEVRKFLNQRLSSDSNRKRTGFQDTVKRIDDLRELVRTSNLPIQTDSDGGKYVILPPYYFQYVRFDAFMYRSCVKPTPATTSETLYTANVQLNIPSGTLTSYTITLNTPTGNRVLFTLADLPTNYLIGTTVGTQRFRLINAIRIKIKEVIRTHYPDSSVSVFWEDAPNNSSLSLFRIESITQFTNVVVNVNGTNTTTVPETSTRMRYLKSSTPLVGNIRVIDAEFAQEVRNSPLSRSNARSPIGELRGNRLYVFDPESVVIGSLDITYITQPDVIDLSLNSNLNMSTKSAKEIVSNTVRFLKAIIQDNNYEAYARENVLIE